MAKVKLYVTIGGRNNWRLRVDREAAQYLREFNCQRVKVILPGYEEFYLDDQMRVYGYCTLTHPNINRWIITNHFNRGKNTPAESLSFLFSVEGNTHIYRYLGRRRQN
jgi:hypothetical protein